MAQSCTGTVLSGCKFKNRKKGSSERYQLIYVFMMSFFLFSFRHLISICPKLASLNLTSCKGISRGYKHEHDKDSIDKMRTGNGVKLDGT